MVEWLDSMGLDPSVESPAGVTPIAVALEYKRMATARRLQQLRDRRRTPAETAPAAAAPAQAAPAAPTAPEEVPTPPTVPTARAPAAPAASASSPGTPPRTPTAPTAAATEPGPAPSLSFANREAAEQALEAGRKALGSGNLQRALTLLRKVHTCIHACMLTPHPHPTPSLHTLTSHPHLTPSPHTLTPHPHPTPSPSTQPLQVALLSRPRIHRRRPSLPRTPSQP